MHSFGYYSTRSLKKYTDAKGGDQKIYAISSLADEMKSRQRSGVIALLSLQFQFDHFFKK